MTISFEAEIERISQLVAAKGWILRNYDLHQVTFEDIQGGTFTLDQNAWKHIRKMLLT